MLACVKRAFYIVSTVTCLYPSHWIALPWIHTSLLVVRFIDPRARRQQPPPQLDARRFVAMLCHLAAPEPNLEEAYRAMPTRGGSRERCGEEGVHDLIVVLGLVGDGLRVKDELSHPWNGRGGGGTRA